MIFLNLEETILPRLQRKYRIAILLALLALTIACTVGMGLLDRWYGQIIGDTLEVESLLLSKFRHEKTMLNAFIVIPISSKLEPDKKYPVMYHLHGFGGDYMDASEEASALRIRMRRHPETEMIHVFLDASLGDGYHYFVNSNFTGPWEDALIQDFIPELEKNFPVIASPSARFLTGHSSGGWSALWLQIHNPDFFGGVWSVSPDPVDFSSFFGIDVTAASKENFYKDLHGKARMVARAGKYRKTKIHDYVVEDEEDTERCDGDFGSYECAWSPQGVDGLPLPLFDRKTGAINPEVASSWEKHDLRLILQNNWTELFPKLAGKLHLFCGAQDDFFLEKSFVRMCDFMKKQGVNNVCELIPGRGHGDVYLATKKSPDGLEFRIDKEARQSFDSHKVLETSATKTPS